MRAPLRRGHLALAIVAAFWLAPGLAATTEFREADLRNDERSSAPWDNAPQRRR